MSAVPTLAHLAPYTVSDLLEMPHDGNRYEVLDGVLHVSPPPSVAHQTVGDALRNLLATHLPTGLRAVTAVAVRCGDDNLGLVPDVVVAAFDPRTAGNVLDANQVLCAVEIVSPGSRRDDRTVKPEIYATAGIEWFWRVELAKFRGQLPGEVLPVVFVHRLSADGYELVARVAAGATGTAPGPVLVSFDPADLLA